MLGEAGNQGLAGKMLVGNVAMNRAANNYNNWGRSLADQIERPSQFEYLTNTARKQADDAYNKQSPAWLEAMDLAKAIAYGYAPDNSYGASSFRSGSVQGAITNPLGKLGGHTFGLVGSEKPLTRGGVTFNPMYTDEATRGVLNSLPWRDQTIGGFDSTDQLKGGDSSQPLDLKIRPNPTDTLGGTGTSTIEGGTELDGDIIDYPGGGFGTSDAMGQIIWLGLDRANAQRQLAEMRKNAADIARGWDQVNAIQNQAATTTATQVGQNIAGLNPTFNPTGIGAGGGIPMWTAPNITLARGGEVKAERKPEPQWDYVEPSDMMKRDGPAEYPVPNRAGKGDRRDRPFEGFADGGLADEAKRRTSAQSKPRKEAPGLMELLKQTWPARMAKDAVEAVKLPGDVYAGRANPMSDESIGRAFDLAGTMALGATAAPRVAAQTGEAVVGSGPIRAYHGSPHDLPMDEAARMARAKEMGFNTDEVFYHGSAADFPHFRAGRTNDATHTPHETPAIFLTSDPSLANEYAMSAAKGRRDKVADIYARNDRETPQRYYQEARASENNARYAAMLEKSAAAVPEGQPYTEMLRHMIQRGDPINETAVRKALGPAADRVLELRGLAQSVGEFYPPGAQVYPVHAKGNLLDVDSGIFGGSFNEVMYDHLLKRAKDQGYEGLRVRNVVDSPSGKGDAADVVAMFDPSAIRSKFAKFDPEKASSGNLLAGGALAAPALAQIMSERDEKRDNSKVSR
jgi:hypothetical protein